MSETVQTSRSGASRTLPLLIGGCALLALCAVVAGAAGAGYWYLNGRKPATAAQPAVEYILDASPRMSLEAEGETRLKVAQGVLAEIVRPAEASVTAGLRVFGSGALAAACKDTDLVVPLAPANQGTISDSVLGLAAGTGADAAMGEALVAAIRDLAGTRGPHTLVVVTGGTDSCNPEAGKLIAQEAEKAGIEFELFMVGYQVPDDESAALKGMITETPGATYLNALDAEELRAILDAIQTRIDKPSNLSIANLVATESGGSITPIAAGSTLEPSTPAPTDAAVPTEAGRATGGPTSDSGGSVDTGGWVSQTACDNPYFPLRAGAVWNYTSTYGDWVWTVSDVSGDLDSATANMVYSGFGSSITWHWQCSRDGLVSYDFGSVSATGTDILVDFKVVDSSGTWLPPAGQLNGPNAWTHAYTMVYSWSAAGTSMEYSTSVTQHSSTDGARLTMSVGAGTVEALRVDDASTYVTSGSGIPSNSSASTSTYWYGYGVGIVKSESSTEGASQTTELTSYSIP